MEIRDDNLKIKISSKVKVRKLIDSTTDGQE